MENRIFLYQQILTIIKQEGDGVEKIPTSRYFWTKNSEHYILNVTDEHIDVYEGYEECGGMQFENYKFVSVIRESEMEMLRKFGAEFTEFNNYLASDVDMSEFQFYDNDVPDEIAKIKNDASAGKSTASSGAGSNSAYEDEDEYEDDDDEYEYSDDDFEDMIFPVTLFSYAQPNRQFDEKFIYKLWKAMQK